MATTNTRQIERGKTGNKAARDALRNEFRKEIMVNADTIAAASASVLNGMREEYGEMESIFKDNWDRNDLSEGSRQMKTVCSAALPLFEALFSTSVNKAAQEMRDLHRCGSRRLEKEKLASQNKSNMILKIEGGKPQRQISSRQKDTKGMTSARRNENGEKIERKEDMSGNMELNSSTNTDKEKGGGVVNRGEGDQDRHVTERKIDWIERIPNLRQTIFRSLCRGAMGGEMHYRFLHT